MTYRVAVVGTGPDQDIQANNGVSTAYRHATGYHRLEDCQLTSCVDIDREHCEAFAETFTVERVYTDHRALLETEDIDIVSVCVPPGSHADIVKDCATLGDVEAVHCEVPMATTWDDCESMVSVCDSEDTQLSFNHHQRFSRPATEAKQHLDDGKIGELRRIEWSASNLFTAGSHRFDLGDYFTRGSPPRWALAGVDTDPDNRWYGALNEVMGVSQWEYDNGVQGFASTAEGGRETLVDAYLRLVGDEGIIEIQPEDGPALRMRTDGRWQRLDTNGETIYGRKRNWYEETFDRIAGTVLGQSRLGPRTAHDRTIEHVVSSLDAGVEPRVSGRRTLRGTELLYACWESARRRGRVDLPLEYVGNPLEALCMEKYGRVGGDSEPHHPRDETTGGYVSPDE